jgi:hypothetical protein
MQSKTRTLNLIIALAMISALAAVTVAEVVYTTDGRKIAGSVERDGDNVVITTEDGQTIVLPSDQVLHISYLPADGEDTDEGGDTTEEPNESDPVDDGGDEPPPPERPRSGFEDSGNVVPASATFSMGKATFPESIAFMLMRRVQAAYGGDTSQLRQSVKQWQATSHDRERRCQGQWLSPGDFTARRNKYARLLAESRETIDELESVDDQERHRQITKDEATKERRRLKAQLVRDMKKAAAVWADPEIRSFLEGIALYREEDWLGAAAAFQRARDANPLVAAYHQGVAESLMKVEGHELKALEAALDELLLHPEEPETLGRVKEAMQRTPGHLTEDKQFQRASDLVDAYPSDWTRKRRWRGYQWQMPGKDGWLVRDDSLPEPPYDRIAIRQGAGVPVAENVLLVDRDVVDGAHEVFVRIDDDTVAVGLVGRRSQRETEATYHFSLVWVVGYVFTPAVINPDATFQADDAVEAFGANHYPEMGGKIRGIRSKLIADGSALRPELSLAPGESGSGVLTADRRLAGFLVGQTDVLEDGGGEGLFIPQSGFGETILRQTARASSSSRQRPGRRVITWRQVDGDAFLVFGLFGEKLD